MDNTRSHRLTEEQKAELKALLEAGWKTKDAAREYGIGETAVTYYRKKWGLSKKRGTVQGVVRCAVCGRAKNLPGAKFCSWCGAPIKTKRQSVLEGLEALGEELEVKGMGAKAVRDAIRYIAEEGRE